MNTFKTAPIPLGDSVGIILPDEALARMNLKVGDTMFLTTSADGLLLSPFAPTSDATSPADDEFAPEGSETSRSLAKHPDGSN